MRAIRSVSPMLLFAAACLLLAMLGMQAGLERFITPEKGLGYTHGIIGGSAMRAATMASRKPRTRPAATRKRAKPATRR